MTHHQDHDDRSDRKAGAGAYKADQAETAHAGTAKAGRRPPFHLNLGPNREIKADYRQVGIAAGALGLGFLAYKAVSALFSGRDDRLRPEPLARSSGPGVKDNAAPRFNKQGSPNRVDEPGRSDEQRPFMAASEGGETSGFVVEATEVDVVAVEIEPADRSAATAEHVPADLMGDRPPSANDRAPDAFRPDPTAPVPEGMRESLRPATGPATGFAANRGDFASGRSQTDGSK